MIISLALCNVIICHTLSNSGWQTGKNASLRRTVQQMLRALCKNCPLPAAVYYTISCPPRGRGGTVSWRPAGPWWCSSWPGRAPPVEHWLQTAECSMSPRCCTRLGSSSRTDTPVAIHTCYQLFSSDHNHGALWHIVFLRLRNILTYLLTFLWLVWLTYKATVFTKEDRILIKVLRVTVPESCCFLTRTDLVQHWTDFCGRLTLQGLQTGSPAAAENVPSALCKCLCKWRPLWAQTVTDGIVYELLRQLFHIGNFCFWVWFFKQLLLKNCAVDFVEICNVCTRKVIIKVAKRIFNTDKIYRSYCDFYFGVTFLEHTVETSINSKHNYLLSNAYTVPIMPRNTITTVLSAVD